MRDSLNRARWSQDQKAKAAAAFAAAQPDPTQERAAKLAAFRKMEAMMATMPHMAPTLQGIRQQIAYLSK